jgi:spermidine synthase
MIGSDQQPFCFLFSRNNLQAKLVGVPCGIAVQLILDGKITKKGVLAPYSLDIVEPLLAEVEKEGISMVDRTIS